MSIYPKVVDWALPVITWAAKSIVSSPEVVPAAVTFKLVKMSKSAEVLPSTPACDASVAPKSVFRSAKVILMVWLALAPT